MSFWKYDLIRRWKQRLGLLGVLMSIAFFISACSTPTTKPEIMDTDNSRILKSPNDQREYRAIELANGLTAMLVSDPKSDKAAAAMDVDVGSGSDPKDRQGLAHFLEHMLFLGTEKYPEPGEYQAFINQNGGSHNAFTAFEHTNYFFDVDAEALEPALDRFSQQFVAPLFSEEYVDREKNAVHSEYTSKLRDDGRRYFAVVKQVLNKEHPMAKFAVGNLETLSDQGDQSIRDDLLEFYRKYYSADRMKLVVLGNESLDQLETMVREKFAGVTQRETLDKPARPPMFDRSGLPALVKLKPIKEKRSLSLLFELPPTEPYYRSKPVYYISNLIGHEGEGSLLSWLKDQKLAEALSSGLFTSDDDGAVLSISISLTEAGVTHYQDVIRDTMTYIELMKSKGLENWRFEEQATMLDIAFRFLDKSAPIHYVSSLASRLQDHSPEEVLKVPFMMERFDETVLKEFTDRLDVSNMLAILMAPDVHTDQTERWYDVPYSVSRLTPQQIKYIQKDNPQATIHLPHPNDFIPENLELLAGASMDKPVLIHEEKGYQAWYAQDTSFGSPKSSFYLSVRTPEANGSPTQNLLTELYVTLAKDELSEFSYPAYLAGLDFKLYKHLRGITLRIDGYGDKQPVLLEKVIDTLVNMPVRSERFLQNKRDIQRELRNSLQNKPFERLAADARTWLLDPYWSETQLLEALDGIQQSDLEAFIPAFWNRFNLVSLAHGNISEKQARQNIDVVETHLMQGANIVDVAKSDVVRLGQEDWYRQVESDHQDSAYFQYVQGPSKGYEDRAAFGLIAQIMSPAYYYQIRTEAQMGYVVFATPYTLLETPALAFIVQSPSHSVAEIHEATDNFLKGFGNTILTMPEEEFERHKEALITRLTESDKTLAQRSDRYWTEIDVENADFDSLVQVADRVKQLTLENLSEYFEEHFVKTPRNMVLVATPDNRDNLQAYLNLAGSAQAITDKSVWMSKNSVFPAAKRSH